MAKFVFNTAQKNERDLIETHKDQTGSDGLDVGNIFPLAAEPRTRGHRHRLQGKRFSNEMKRLLHSDGGEPVEFASKRPVEATLLNIFKKGIDTFLDANSVKEFAERQWCGIIVSSTGFLKIPASVVPVPPCYCSLLFSV